MYELRFDINPVAASRPRVTRAGHTYYAGPYKDFRKAMTQQIEERVGDFEPLLAPLNVAIVCHITKPKTTKLPYPRADVDNYAKAVLDSLNGVIWEDDKQITSLSINKGWTESHEQPGWIELFIEVEDGADYEQDEDGTWRYIRYRA